MSPTVEAPVAARVKIPGRRWWIVPLGAAVLVYLVLALWLAYTKAPWCDEAWFVNPAFNLAVHGYMGSNVLEPSGHYLNAYLRGVQQRTYIFPPNHLVALAGWIRLFGFSALLVRLYSISWGALGLAALYYVLLRAFPDRKVAQLAILFTSIDFVYLWSTADGRPEAMAFSLAMASVAAYLHFREKNLALAVFVSQMLAAAAAFAHLNALLIVLGLIGMALFLDRRLLKLRYVLYAGIPYAFFAGLWSVYIWQKPSDFVAQFLPQAGYSERWKGFLHPDLAIGTEINRHLASYSIDSLWSGAMIGWAVFVPLFYAAAMVWFVASRRRMEKIERAFFIFTLVLALGTTFLNGFKAYFYLIYVVPIYAAVLAAWLLGLWAGSMAGRCFASVIVLAFVFLQLWTSIMHIRADEYHRDFEPAVRELARYRAEGKTIVGTAALGFGLDFAGFHDDIREGAYSHLEPDILVLDRSYRTFAQRFETAEPGVFSHIVTMIPAQYRLVSKHGSFWILEHVPPSTGGKTASWLDPRELDKVRKGGRADYFFNVLYGQNRP